jgi:diacylglycerol kinase (ATP)
MRACIIFNPTARGQKAARLRDQLTALARDCALKPTYAAGSGRALAAEAVREGFQTIVAAGGDGTVNEVLNGIGDEPAGFERTRLGILPTGTINVFARDLELPSDIERAWRVILEQRETKIDLPRAEFILDGTPQRRYFVQLGGAGLDSRAIELVNWEHKKKVGALAYVLAGFRALLQSKSSILVSNEARKARGELVLMGNGRHYGGRFPFFPKADFRDGLLDVLVFPRANWLALLQTGWGWLIGRIHQSAGAESFQAKTFTLSSPDPTRLELDGENVGFLPATVSVLPLALRVLVP